MQNGDAMTEHRLKDKVAVVTGGARGIGEAIARRLAADGARCAILDLDLPEAEAVAESLPGAIAVRCDIADEAEVKAMAARVDKAFGRADILVNNASILDTSSFNGFTMEHYQRVIDINMTGALLVSQAIVPIMQREKRGGRVIHIASINGVRGQPGNLPYAVAKGGVVQLGRVMAAELGKDGITVNVVCPGFIATRMAFIPGTGQHESETDWFQDVYMKHGRLLLGRYGTPEDVAGATYFFASDDSRYVTGQVMLVDGGITATF